MNIKLKHITGFSKLFEDVKYNNSWETKGQISLRINYEKENNATENPVKTP